MDQQQLEGPGIKLDQTIFRINDTLAPGTWQSQPVGGVPKVFVVAKGGPEALTIGTVERERERELPGGATELAIHAAPDLRDQLRDVIEGIEADERREREARDRERMEEVTEQLDEERLIFSGTVTLSPDDDAPLIGGDPVLPEVAKRFGQGRPLVEVYLGAEREPAMTAAGEAVADEGWAGTDETPSEVPVIEVGKFDLLGKLREYDGRHVELVVRTVERPQPFYVEVDPQQHRETWLVPDPRFSGQNRRIADLTGEALVGLVTDESPARRIIVGFDPPTAERVELAIDEYREAERERGVVLPSIEVVPGKGSGAASGALEVIEDPHVTEPHFIAGVARTGFGLAGIDTAEELATAQRGLEGHRDCKLVAFLDLDAVEKLLVEEDGRPYLAGADKGAWQSLTDSIAAAKSAKGTKAEGTEPLEPIGPRDDEFATRDAGDLATEADVVILHEGHELTVYVDRRLGYGEWTVAEGMDPAHRFTGGFTTDKVRELIALHHETLTVGLDLLPNAIAVLVGIGEVSGERDISKWCDEIRSKFGEPIVEKPAEPEPEPEELTASGLIIGAIREAAQILAENAGEASKPVGPFPSRMLTQLALVGGPLATPPASPALRHASDKLFEALAWAERHEKEVARQEAERSRAMEQVARTASMHFGGGAFDLKPGT